MIEVNNTIKALFEVTPATGLAVEVGKTSIPIMISTDNAPYESVDIELSLSD